MKNDPHQKYIQYKIVKNHAKHCAHAGLIRLSFSRYDLNLPLVFFKRVTGFEWIKVVWSTVRALVFYPHLFSNGESQRGRMSLTGASQVAGCYKSTLGIPLPKVTPEARLTCAQSGICGINDYQVDQVFVMIRIKSNASQSHGRCSFSITDGRGCSWPYMCATWQCMVKWWPTWNGDNPCESKWYDTLQVSACLSCQLVTQTDWNRSKAWGGTGKYTVNQQTTYYMWYSIPCENCGITWANYFCDSTAVPRPPILKSSRSSAKWQVPQASGLVSTYSKIPSNHVMTVIATIDPNVTSSPSMSNPKTE